MFFATYILLGILGFFLVTFVGSHLLEARLEKSITSDIYQTAHRIAESDLVRHNITSTNVESVQNTLSLAANYPDTIIWIINSNGQIILSTRKDISPDHPIDLDGFDPASWGSNYYQIGDFYGYFHDSRLSTIAPITEHLNIRGYVAVHYLMSDLYQSRSSLLWIIQLLFVITYLMTAVLFLFYSFYIRKPLYAITKGASEFANGNLSYQIPVKSENELGYLAMNMKQADKLNRNGEYQRQFISNISHDFRSPLTSIKGYVEAMIDGTIPVEMQEKYLKIISYEAERLEKLTRGLLTLNELDIHKRMLNIQDFDINQTIKSTAASFEGTCTTRQILLELILSGQTLYAHADLEQIQQVLYNLLSNAIKFSPDHSTITIETTEKNGKIFVSVKDHGIGIPKSSLNRIWERFYKIDRSRGKDQKGTGLGLAIVKEIISAHGQHINVISTEGVGTEFIFTLEKAK